MKRIMKRVAGFGILGSLSILFCALLYRIFTALQQGYEPSITESILAGVTIVASIGLFMGLAVLAIWLLEEL